MSLSYLQKLKDAGPQDNKALLQKLEKNTNRQTFWSPTRDKTGKGSATIRFLPAVSETEEHMIELYHHGFKDDTTGLWYIENSRTTLGQRDPLTEFNQYNFRLAETTNNEQLRALVSKRKRNHYRIVNIYVIDDPGNPQNNGTVQLYRFGTRIYDKLMAAMKPEFAGLTPIPVFDLWHGHNFNIRVAMDSNKIPQYDQSSFDPLPSALLDGDVEKLTAILEKATPLSKLLAPKEFKSWTQLAEQLVRVIGPSFESWLHNEAKIPNEDGAEVKAKPKAEKVQEKPVDNSVPWEGVVAPPPKPKAAAAVSSPKEPVADLDDETAALFESIQEQIGDL